MTSSPQLTDLKQVLAHFSALDPKIFKILQTVDLQEWFDDTTPDQYFIKLCRTIIYQQLAGSAAATIYGRFANLIGGHVDPAHIAKLELQQMRDVGLSWAKAKYVKDLAEQVLANSVSLIDLATKSDEDVIAELTKVKGIGRWTAEMFLMFNLKRENVFSYGDLGLKKGFSQVYDFQAPTIDDIKPVVDLWSPYKTYGSIALWHYLDTN